MIHRILLVAALLPATFLPASAGPAGPGDGGPATEATLEFPLGLALGPDGAVYVSERRGNRVRRVDPRTHEISTVAGTGERGYSGDGGPAAAARIACPDSIDVDDQGNLFIADRCNHRIRRVDGKTGLITTIAGNGTRAPSPDGPSAGSSLMGPFYVRSVSDDKLLYTDTDSDRVRIIDLASGRIETLAGSGERGFAGDGGSALEAKLARPHVALYARNGDLIIGDSANQRIRRVDARTGIITTVAGDGSEGAAPDGTPAHKASFGYFGEIHELENGDLLFSEWVNGRILRLEKESGRIGIVAGTTDENASAADGHDPRETRFRRLADFVIEAGGTLLVVEAEAGLVRRIDPKKHEVKTVVGR